MTALALGTADPEPWLFVPPLPSPAPPLPLMGYPAARPPLVEHRAMLAKRRKLYASLVDGNSDDQRAVQLARWLELIEMGLDCSKIGSQIREYQNCDKEYLIENIIADTLAKQSTGTLSSRPSSIFMYLKWLSGFAGKDVKPFPLQEPLVYEYFVSLHKDRAPPTRATSLMQAWSFCVHILGFSDPTDLCNAFVAEVRYTAIF